MEPSLKIENVELGKKLIEIKNNKVIVESPFSVVGGGLLTISQALVVFANGLLADTSTGPTAIFFPNATSIISALGLVAGQQVQFTVTAYGVGTLTLGATTGTTIIGGPASFLAGSVHIVTLVCTSSTTLNLTYL